MHPQDDVARNIRNEQMADGAPTAEEAKAMHRKHLASEGCSKCDEDDPDRLDTYYKPFPSCPRYQSPPDPTIILCDDHKDSIESIREREINRAREKNDRESDDENEIVAVVFYGCDMSDFVRKVEPPTNDRGEPRQPYPGETIPETLIECRFCNSCLDEVIRLKDVRAEERIDHVREILAESRTVDMSPGMIRHALLDRGDPDAENYKPVKKAISELHSEGEIEITRRKGWSRPRYALVSDADENEVDD